MKLKIKKLHPDAIIPQYQTEGAACFDLHAIIPERVPRVILSSSPETFRTGLAFEVPDGWALLIYSRSGHCFGHDTRLANCVGVIDADYRGEVQVRLTRDSSPSGNARVVHGDRIAQVMLIQAPRVALVEVDELFETVRRAGGFGSTGVIDASVWFSRWIGTPSFASTA